MQTGISHDIENLEDDVLQINKSIIEFLRENRDKEKDKQKFLEQAAKGEVLAFT